LGKRALSKLKTTPVRGGPPYLNLWKKGGGVSRPDGEEMGVRMTSKGEKRENDFNVTKTRSTGSRNACRALHCPGKNPRGWGWKEEAGGLKPGQKGGECCCFKQKKRTFAMEAAPKRNKKG